MAEVKTSFGLLDPNMQAINSLAERIKYYYYNWDKSMMWPDDFYTKLKGMQRRVPGYQMFSEAIASCAIMPHAGVRIYPMPLNSTSNITYSHYKNTLREIEFSQCLDIGSYAFYNCTYLSSISLPMVYNIKPYAFTNTQIANVILPSLYSLSSFAFQDNTQLSFFSAPLLRDIGAHIFQGCIKLSEVFFDNVLELESRQFENETNWVSLHFSLVELIPAYCFAGCTSLETFEAPFGSTYNEYAFTQCGFVNLVNSQATYVKDGCFQSCPNLRTVDLPIVATLGRSVFANCPNLISVRVDKLPEIYNGTFTGCGKAYYYAPNTTIIESNTFAGNQISYISADKLETINMSTFANCPNLRSVYMPNLKTIRTYGFYNTPISQISLDNLETVQPYGMARTKLSKLYAPKLKNLEANSFESSPITEASLPVCEYIGVSAFWGNGAQQGGYVLSKVYAPKCKRIEGRALFNMNTLNEIYIPECEFVGGDALAWLGTCNITIRDLVEAADFAFNGTAFGTTFTLSRLKTIRYGAFANGSCRTIYADNLEYLNYPGANIAVYIKNSICSLAHSQALAGNTKIYIPRSYWNIYASREFFSTQMGTNVLSY